jgi:hypothetical protein
LYHKKCQEFGGGSATHLVCSGFALLNVLYRQG